MPGKVTVTLQKAIITRKEEQFKSMVSLERIDCSRAKYIFGMLIPPTHSILGYLLLESLSVQKLADS